MSAEQRALEQVLRDSMPVAGRLGVQVDSYIRKNATGVLLLRAPLALNLNDKGTAFAGSLAMVATLTGWSMMWLLLREYGISGDIVLQDSSVKYLRPVTSDFAAAAIRPEDDTLLTLFQTIERRGKGRLKLTVTMNDVEGIKVTFTGRYVVSVR